MDAATTKIALSLTDATLERLRQFAAATNSPIDNAANRAINDGINAAIAQWPILWAQIAPHR